MKHLIFLVLAVLIICSNIETSAQSRNSRSDLLTIQTQSSKLRSATGWKIDALGNWISNDNSISDTKLTDATKYSASQNFKWLQFVLLKNSDQNIYALFYESNSYTSALQSERRVYYFLMTNKAYSQIVSAIQSKTGETVNIQASSFGYMSDSDGVYSTSKLLKLIEQSISRSNNSPEYTLSINAQHVDNEDVVRFKLPEQGMASRINSLKDSYFETSLNDFKEVLLPLNNSIEQNEFELDNTSKSLASNNQSALSVQDDFSDRNSRKTDRSNTNTFSQTQYTSSESEDSITKDLNERANKETAIVSAPIAQFSNIECWYQGKDGEWVKDSSPNYRFETVGKYEMRNFKYRNKEYILITRFEKYTGSSYYLITKEDYLNVLVDLEDSSILKFPLVAYAGIGNTLRDMIEISEKAIDTPKKKDLVVYKTNYMVVQYKLSETKNISRFFIYFQECSKYGAQASKENCNTKVSNKIKYDDEAILGSDILFNKAYYESSYNDFMDFFRKPVSSSELPKQKKKLESNDLDLEDR